ncbi:TPA: GIY-YIG nuclease [Candidatus Nomurabacteria bacterium]|nr:GIY-YIG nuclease [Candidatus Nomurabacteria bacterium]
MKQYYVYILASKRYGTLYIGVTSDLKRRVSEHKEKKIDGFTKEYNITNLVWYEATENIESAIKKEKQLKAWQRQWKVELIEKSNLEWRDLSSEI